MSKLRSTLDTLSGFLFIVGFIASKLKSAPIFIVAAIFNLVSMFAYLIGYAAWYVAALLYPEYPKKRESWFGFAAFKEQYQLAALFGAIATITTFMCIIMPALIVAAAWFYTISNLIWTISEYHKKENPPPDDEQYSSDRQALYFRYTTLVAISSGLTASAATIAMLFPPAAFVVITAASIFGLGLSIVSLYYYVKSALGNHLPDKIGHSYSKLSEQLDFKLDNTPEPDQTYAPKQIVVESNITTPCVLDEDNIEELHAITPS